MPVTERTGIPKFFAARVDPRPMATIHDVRPFSLPTIAWWRERVEPPRVGDAAERFQRETAILRAANQRLRECYDAPFEVEDEL